MRAVGIIFMAILLSTSLWISGCATQGGGGTADRIIRAQPNEVLEAVGQGFARDGMTLVSRSDRGDIYEMQLSPEDLTQHRTLAQLADRGSMSLRARVSRSQIEFTSRLEDTDSVVGFIISLSPAEGGAGTRAHLQPIVRIGAAEDSELSRRIVARLESRFSRIGERMLESIADIAES